MAKAAPGPTLGTSTRDAAVAQMFAELAPEYDRMNAVITFGLAQNWRRELVRRALPARNCLDFGCGTGDLTEAVLGSDPQARLTGFDLTGPMLHGAKARLSRSGLLQRARLVQGDGEHLPFDDAVFDTVVSSFVMRNVGDRVAGYREIARVLRPGGRFLQLELGKPSIALLRAGYMLYFKQGMPRLASLFSKQRDSFAYLAESIDRWPDRQGVTEEIRSAGFSTVRDASLLFGGVAIFEARR